MLLKVAFQMDADVVVGKDLTVQFIQESKRRGHDVFFYQPRDLSFSRGEVVATAYSVDIGENSLHLRDRVRLSLEGLDILFIRQNPPFDMRYITNTYLLERLAGVLFVNDPKAIRDFPEKLLPLSFPEFIPPTLMTESVQEACEFYREYGDVVIKPLYSFGGDGVIRICGNVDIAVIFDVMVARYGTQVVIQQIIPSVEDDKRVVLLNGEPIGAIKRRVISSGEIRTNLRVGAVPEMTELSERDREICRVVGDKLTAAGIIFAGIDILGGYLLEVNVTSPCGILEINQVYGTTLEKECWDQFEGMLA
ncbi:Glutathione synthetase [Anaplasma phagocytophilum]|nr:Glutathione synthetase [Anaplasma phagocytophilum]